MIKKISAYKHHTDDTLEYAKLKRELNILLFTKADFKIT